MKRSSSALSFVLGTGALIAVVWWLYASEPATEAGHGRPPYVLPVTLASVEQGELAPRVLLTGSVLSAQRSRVGFEIAGRIVAVAAAEGDRIPAGGVLARLDERDAHAELRRAEAAAERAERELDRWLAGARDEEKRRLTAELEVRKAEAELASKEVERGRELATAKIISQSQFDTLVSESATAQARVNSATEALAVAQAGSRPEEIEVQKAEVELRRAEVEIARRELEKSTLVAPYDACVVRRLASTGDSVAAGEALFELVDLALREIEVEVPSAFATHLGDKPPARVSLEEYPDFSLETEVDALVPAADLESRNFRALIRLAPEEDREGQLMPGMFVRVDLGLEPLSDVLLVPSDSVRVVPSGSIVVKAAPAPSAPASASPAGNDGDAPPSGAHAGPPPPPFVAEWVYVSVLGSEGGKSAVLPVSKDSAAALAVGDQVVVTGVDLAFPSAPLMPRVATPAAPAQESAQ